MIALHALNNSVAYAAQADGGTVSLVFGPLMMLACALVPRLTSPHPGLFSHFSWHSDRAHDHALLAFAVPLCSCSAPLRALAQTSTDAPAGSARVRARGRARDRADALLRARPAGGAPRPGQAGRAGRGADVVRVVRGRKATKKVRREVGRGGRYEFRVQGRQPWRRPARGQARGQPRPGGLPDEAAASPWSTGRPAPASVA